MRFRKFLKPYKTRGSSFREHTRLMGGAFIMGIYLNPDNEGFWEAVRSEI